MLSCKKKMRHKLSHDTRVIKKKMLKKKDRGHDITEDTIMYDW